MSIDSSVDIEVRQIKTGSNPTRYARGWHCVGLAKTFRDGKPHQVKIFGTDLVVFEDSRNELKILDAFCRHMGGNLARGEIKDGNIACPFHDWRWGGDGRCKDVPYARRVPKIARTRTWITLERNGILFVWNDPQGNPPPADVTIPEIEGYGTDRWTEWTWNTFLVEGSNCREIVDNVVDMAHFFYVHFQMPQFFKNVFEGHVASQHMRSTGRDDIKTGVQLDLPDSETISDASYHGPSFMLDTVYTVSGDIAVETKLINCHYPITQDSFLLQYGTIVERVKGVPAEESDAMATMFTEGVETQFKQDVEIWKHKSRIENPLLTEEDGPVYQLRRWYNQFYVDIEDVTPDMTRRFEFEVDTTRALENWQVEVEENLAAE
ncbi:Rieske 2Fe-2S domain-containing protein [Rhodococcus sp. ARC_M6]|uniref:Rieske 2Fe-2S domain-containing protein n=1 Tax=Rhodococcus sp. ARC_M6 TaxID=2928852 RepID=UPI001FB5647D|nr:Rieske 2Fe-2S domain-containing protein [Rhodococcus sp. ARC_M6]MCJ0902798.1 aromatic ring-hydroxylating dioxygenase subunit alpha [Rhodococcus sp. ARC_M6]